MQGAFCFFQILTARTLRIRDVARGAHIEFCHPGLDSGSRLVNRWSGFFNEYIMALGETILKKLSKIFAPSAMIRMKIGRQDVVILTDEHGNAVQMFMGKAAADGTIKGDRYARTLKFDRDGRVIKDHWERKGRST